MPETISVTFACAECSLAKTAVKVRERLETESVIDWFEGPVKRFVSMMHSILSPLCQAKKIDFIKIPLLSARGVGFAKLPQESEEEVKKTWREECRKAMIPTTLPPRS